MAQRLGVGKPEIEAILNGEVDENLLYAMARELKLDGEKLIRSAKKNGALPRLNFQALS